MRCGAAFSAAQICGKSSGGNAKPPHAGVHLQVDRMFYDSEPNRRFFQQFDLSRLPNRGSKFLADNFFFFAAPEAGHQEDAPLNSRIAQRDGFIERRDSLPARAFFFQSTGALDGAVTVGIGFHHGANINARADVPTGHGKVVAQIAERNLRPSGTRRHTFDDFNGGRHCCRL